MHTPSLPSLPVQALGVIAYLLDAALPEITGQTIVNKQLVKAKYTFAYC
jgi:hypothetical protein